MPYKIYTYADPYNLDKADFWQEIASLPHFCVSRTLVNGLKENLRDSIQGLLCPLDDFVSHESVYYQWTKNISLRVRQHSELTALFKGALLLDSTAVKHLTARGFTELMGVRAVEDPSRQPAIPIRDALESHRVCFMAG